MRPAPSSFSRIPVSSSTPIIPSAHDTSETAIAAEVEQLRAQLDRAHRLAAVGELMGTTTHEFNNLLMTVLNYARLGQRHKDEASRDKAFARILDAANRATKISASILHLSRNRSGQMEPTDLRPIIENTLLLLEREFRKYRVAIESHIDEHVPEVLAFGNDLQRVLINLLTNARQATKEGGTVRVLLQHDQAAGEVLLVVRDTGVGIAPETLPRIFEPYFSTKSGPDASGKGGSGVGLSCCKDVIDAHGGRIRVESTLGKGTAFHVRLPARCAR